MEGGIGREWLDNFLGFSKFCGNWLQHSIVTCPGVSSSFLIKGAAKGELCSKKENTNINLVTTTVLNNKSNSTRSCAIRIVCKRVLSPLAHHKSKEILLLKSCLQIQLQQNKQNKDSHCLPKPCGTWELLSRRNLPWTKNKIFLFWWLCNKPSFPLNFP